MNDSISFIVITLDGGRLFWETITSVHNEGKADDEIIIVKPSILCINVAESMKDSGIEIRVVSDLGRGIYEAQNTGIENANNKWLCVLNGGDVLETGARSQFQTSIQKNPNIRVHCFSQYVVDVSGMYAYTSYAVKRQFLPHQSIVYMRSLHLEYGLYEEHFRYCADQLFFARLSVDIDFCYSTHVTSRYRLGGYSDAYSLRLSRESFYVRRLFGYNRLQCFIRSFLIPLVRCLLGIIHPALPTRSRYLINRGMQ
jgi:hypothetical protein